VTLTELRDFSSRRLSEILGSANEDILVIGDTRMQVKPLPGMFERLAKPITDSGAGLVYSDSSSHPRIDYQLGSIRDNFDFGPVIAISVRAAREVWQEGSARWGGLYDLRLRLSEKFSVVHINEPLYEFSVQDARPSGEKQFDYVDPRNRDYQIEMENIATAHLQRIGAWLPPDFNRAALLGSIPVEPA
jgi:hypothetical protein